MFAGTQAKEQHQRRSIRPPIQPLCGPAGRSKVAAQPAAPHKTAGS